VSPGLRRRLHRLERERRGGERLRVVEWWPGQPQPKAEPGELLILVKQYEAPPPASREAGG
jgi:hypothetical protein